MHKFLEPIASDCEYFVYGQRTYGNESFHNLCNMYYEKGCPVSFPIFKMKRQFAAMDWNEQMRNKMQNVEGGDIQEWQSKLLARFNEALKS